MQKQNIVEIVTVFIVATKHRDCTSYHTVETIGNDSSCIMPFYGSILALSHRKILKDSLFLTYDFKGLRINTFQMI